MEPRCVSHPAIKAVYFCSDDQVYVCTNCLLSHKKHDFTSVELMLPKVNANYKKISKSIKERVSTLIKIKDGIDHEIQFLINSLKRSAKDIKTRKLKIFTSKESNNIEGNPILEKNNILAAETLKRVNNLAKNIDANAMIKLINEKIESLKKLVT